MHDYCLAHLRNPDNAVGARIKFKDDGSTGTIVEVVSKDYPNEYKVELDNGGFVNVKDELPREFFIQVELKDGIKVMDMKGDVMTLRKHKYGKAFYVQVNDEPEAYKEYIEPNGFAYHYDCGCNILKVM
jgi:hypothetical protein